MTAAQSAATGPMSNGGRAAAPPTTAVHLRPTVLPAAVTRDDRAGRRRGSAACSGVAGGSVGAVTDPESQVSRTEPGTATPLDAAPGPPHARAEAGCAGRGQARTVGP
jgi:hypothetical protein